MSDHRHRVLRSTVGLGLVVALLGGWPVPTAVAGCAGPQLAVGELVEVEPSASTAVLTLGGTATVAGQWFHTGCDDTGQGSGCGAPPSEQEPMSDVPLVLDQGTASVVLATADASGVQDQYQVRWQVSVPAGFVPGPATLRASGATLPVELRTG